MKITTKAHYGLMAMCELGIRYGGTPMSVKKIASIQNCSDSYMEQIFSLLKKAGLIQSARGARGGYTLTNRPEEISVGQIIRALEGPIGFTECSMDQKGEESCCVHEARCISREFWKELYENINSFLENKKLSDLIESCQPINLTIN